MKQSLGRTLLGVFELSIFMPSFLDKFSSDKRDALKSFLFPVLLYPIIAMTFAANQAAEPGWPLMIAHFFVSWGGLFLFYGVVHVLARAMRREDFFWQSIHVLNAQSILTFVLMLPLIVPILGFDAHIEDSHPLTNYWVFLLLAGMAYKAFILAQSLRLNLPLGGFLAVLNLYISDISYRFLAGFSPTDLV